MGTSFSKKSSYDLLNDIRGLTKEKSGDVYFYGMDQNSLVGMDIYS